MSMKLFVLFPLSISYPNFFFFLIRSLCPYIFSIPFLLQFLFVARNVTVANTYFIVSQLLLLLHRQLTLSSSSGLELALKLTHTHIHISHHIHNKTKMKGIQLQSECEKWRQTRMRDTLAHSVAQWQRFRKNETNDTTEREKKVLRQEVRKAHNNGVMYVAAGRAFNEKEQRLLEVCAMIWRRRLTIRHCECRWKIKSNKNNFEKWFTGCTMLTQTHNASAYIDMESCSGHRLSACRTCERFILFFPVLFIVSIFVTIFSHRIFHRCRGAHFNK